MDGDQDRSVADSAPRPQEGGAINMQPADAYEFGQSLNAARSRGDAAACADLLSSVDPERLPRLLSNQLDGHVMAFVLEALDEHLLARDPGRVYRLLQSLHTAERFTVRRHALLLC